MKSWLSEGHDLNTFDCMIAWTGSGRQLGVPGSITVGRERQLLYKMAMFLFTQFPRLFVKGQTCDTLSSSLEILRSAILASVSLSELAATELAATSPKRTSPIQASTVKETKSDESMASVLCQVPRHDLPPRLFSEDRHERGVCGWRSQAAKRQQGFTWSSVPCMKSSQCSAYISADMPCEPVGRRASNRVLLLLRLVDSG